MFHLLSLVPVSLRGDEGRQQLMPDVQQLRERLATYTPSEVVRHCAYNVHPPAYFLALKGWMILWGDSVYAMRTFSVVLGTVTVAMLYGLTWEACTSHLNKRHAALLAAALASVSEHQVSLSQLVRMYSMGSLLTCLTGWLLLKALHKRNDAAVWWVLYGTCGTLFFYAHNYALFSLVAQGMFAAGYRVRAQCAAIHSQRGGWYGMALACGIGAVLYSPWVPVLLAQSNEVQSGYWIEPITLERLSETFFYWGTGLAASPVFLGCICFAALTLIVARGALANTSAWWFFLVQAFIPCIMGVLVSLYGGTSILQVRYLAFAQVTLMGLLAVSCATSQWALQRAGSAIVLIGMLISGMGYRSPAASYKVSSVITILDVVNRYYNAGDVILVDGAGPLNVFTYYSSQCGLEGRLRLQCLEIPQRWQGHKPFLGSLSSDDVIYWDDAAPPNVRRVWQIVESGSPLPLAVRNCVSEQKWRTSDGHTVVLNEIWNRDNE